MNIVTVVKYKLKDGFEDDFIKAINEYDYSNALSMRLISIEITNISVSWNMMK